MSKKSLDEILAPMLIEKEPDKICLIEARKKRVATYLEEIKNNASRFNYFAFEVGLHDDIEFSETGSEAFWKGFLYGGLLMIEDSEEIIKPNIRKEMLKADRREKAAAASEGEPLPFSVIQGGKKKRKQRAGILKTEHERGELE